ncbi:MAG: hypothetical protein ACYC7E_20955 [Armatimonadota bacterium]
MKQLLVVCVVLLAAGALFAQGTDSGSKTGTGESSAQLVFTTKGLFALRSGVLVKYDVATLKPALPPFELFGKAPDPPAANADQPIQQKYRTEMMRRMAPAMMVPKDNSLLIIIGDGYARINQDTLKVEAKADLKNPTAAPEAETGRPRTEPAPAYALVENTLYLLRGTEMLALSITDGKIINRSPLPKELEPIQFNFFGGRGSFTPGGNRGGGDRGGAPPAQ